MAIESRSARLKWARERFYTSAAEFARKMDISDITYRAHESGQREYPELTAKRYASHLNVSWAWLLTGQGHPLQTDNTYLQLAADRESDAGMALSETPADPVVEPSNQPEKTAQRLIPVYATILSKDGSIRIGPTVADLVECPQPLRHVANACAVYCVGSAMDPAYRQGDLLFLHPYRPLSAADDVLCCSGAPLTGTDAHIGRAISWNNHTIMLKRFKYKEPLELDFRTWNNFFGIIGKFNIRC